MSDLIGLQIAGNLGAVAAAETVGQGAVVVVATARRVRITFRICRSKQFAVVVVVKARIENKMERQEKERQSNLPHHPSSLASAQSACPSQNRSLLRHVPSAQASSLLGQIGSGVLSKGFATAASANVEG